jgi:DNA-binding protein WhiA
MISFTINVKNEIASFDGDKNENIAMLSAIIRNSGKIDNEITITTENSKVARRVYTLISDIYNVSVNIIDKNNNFNRNRLYIIKVSDNIDFILKDLGIINENNKYLVNVPDYLIDSDEEKRAYLKGIFMACGSVNDPKTSRYHLEFFIEKEEEANFVNDLLNEYYLNSKVIQKDRKYMVYIKEAEKIGDFLRIIGANDAVMYYEDIRIYRDHKNMTNRLNNMEQANIEKIINTCNSQISDIELIFDKLGKDSLDDKTLEAATYRIKYPESSLQELSEIMTLEIGKPITKSGLNHRMRKIKEIANRLKNSQ